METQRWEALRWWFMKKWRGKRSRRKNERETELAAMLSFFQIFEIFVVLLLDSGAWFGRSGGGEICWRGSNERKNTLWC
jgi:hypothetical protein